MRARSSGSLGAWALTVLFAGCDGPGGATPGDAAPEASADVTPDTTADAPLDVTLDASADATLDATAACAVDAPTACPDASPRYADLVPIFRRRCVTCHDGTTEGPWPLDTYGHISDWQREVRDELVRCSMPPADAGVVFPVEERDAILTWLRCGLPQ